MKKILLSLTFISIGFMALAQAPRQSTPPYSGSFYVSQFTSKGEEKINVNYSLYTPPFINTLNVNFNTPDPMTLSVKVLNANSETVLSWVPDQKSSRYDYQFDIGNLSAGNYHMEVYGADSKKLISIPFTKQAGSTATSGTSTAK